MDTSQRLGLGTAGTGHRETWFGSRFWGLGLRVNIPIGPGNFLGVPIGVAQTLNPKPLTLNLETLNPFRSRHNCRWAGE